MAQSKPRSVTIPESVRHMKQILHTSSTQKMLRGLAVTLSFFPAGSDGGSGWDLPQAFCCPRRTGVFIVLSESQE